MNVNESINNLHSILNQTIDRNGLSVETIELSKEILETLETLRNCVSSHEDEKIKEQDLDEVHKSINVINLYLTKSGEGMKYRNCVIPKLNDELSRVYDKLNKILCKVCRYEKEIKEIKKLTEKCGNKEIATFLHHERKLNAQYYDKCIIWLPFNKFSDIKYLAKSYFGEVHRATCINHYDGSEKKYREVVLKRIYNSNDKIVDILKEVK